MTPKAKRVKDFLITSLGDFCTKLITEAGFSNGPLNNPRSNGVFTELQLELGKSFPSLSLQLIRTCRLEGFVLIKRKEDNYHAIFNNDHAKQKKIYF